MLVTLPLDHAVSPMTAHCVARALSHLCLTEDVKGNSDAVMAAVKSLPPGALSRRASIQAASALRRPEVCSAVDLSPIEQAAVNGGATLDLLKTTPATNLDFCVLCLSLPQGMECPVELTQIALKVSKQDGAEESGRNLFLTSMLLRALARHYQYTYVTFAGLFNAAIRDCEKWLSAVEGLSEAQRQEAVNSLLRKEYVGLLRDLGQQKEADSLCRKHSIN